jgi:LEA14-like dessication related protein
MKKLFSLLATVAAVALLFGGCASVSPAERASLSLVEVTSAQSTIFETTLELTLRVTNETNQPLHVQGSSHRLTLNGSMVGSGVGAVAADVPPLGTATFPVTIRMDNLKLLNRFGRGQLPDGIEYQLDSRLFTPASASGLKVRTTGALDLRPFTNALLLN